MHTYYNDSVKEALAALESHEKGLPKKEAKERLKQYGPNALEIKGVPLWKKIIEPFRSIFMLILFIAASISYGTGENLDGNIIVAIMVINAVIYYVQQFSTERVLRSLRKYEAASVEVFRDGSSLEIPVEDLVPGDIIRLYEGQKVPADARMVSAENVRCDEALLTGESKPVSKKTDALDGEKPVYERNNILFQGSFLVSGEATALVIQTGNTTEFGKIAVLSSDRETESPVQKKIDKLISQIVSVVGVLAVILMGLSFYRDMELADAFHFIVALSVSVIPEGLPVAISVVLVLGMRRMAKRKALVRNMAAIENIGLVTTIASDKTGTLTKNLLEVNTVWQPEGTSDIDALATSIVLGANQKDGVSHDPLDTAFTLFAKKHTVDTKGHEFVQGLPFEAELAMSGNVWKKDGKHVIYVKGSPERILANAGLSKADNDKAADQLHQFTTQGLRVIGLGRISNKNADKLEDIKDEKLEFLGLLAVADELRPEAKKSIEATQAAGVTVRMITGDHFETAFSIGKQLGLVDSRDQVFDSRRMKDMSDKELSEVVAKSRVFARVVPEHKHRILTVLKEQDITAMTGDGVNDVPALANAHIGLAMGSGSQIAKDAGDIILLDNNFKSITAALEEGRKIFDNIRRMLFLLLTTSAGEALTFMTALVLGMPPPILAVQILWVNLVTDTAMVIPLGLEPGESDLMKRKPRRPTKPILGKVIITRMILIAIVMASVTLGFFAYFNQFMSEEYARTVAFSALIVMQWADAFNGRSLWQSIFIRVRTMNKAFYVGLGIAVTIHLMTMYGPFQQLLSITEISIEHFVVTSIIAFIPIILAGEFHKLLIKKIDPEFR